jgi:hypothetical protein
MTKFQAFVLLALFLYTNAFAPKPAAAIPVSVPGIQPALGQTQPAIDSWLTDTIYQKISDVYKGEFQVVTKGLKVITTNPGGFYYNVLWTAMTDTPDLMLSVTLPEDFSLWGDMPVHVWIGSVDMTNPDDETAAVATGSLTVGPLFVPTGTSVFMTVHVRYSLSTLPSSTYLPKVYTFSATATGSGVSLVTSASMTGVLKW